MPSLQDRTKCKGSRSLGNFSYKELEEFEELKDLDEVVLPPEITQPAKVPAPLLRERPGVKEQREAASAIYPRNGKRWNIDEDSSLVEAFLRGNSPVNISKLVERSPSAVRGRIIYWVETSNPRLQFRPLKMSKSYARHGEGWTKSECDELKRGDLGVGVYELVYELASQTVLNQVKTAFVNVSGCCHN